jgi:hypothetical protein
MSAATFYVVKGQKSGNLLSLLTAQDLGFITLHLNNISTKNPADYLSQHSTAKSVRKQAKMTETYVHFLEDSSIPKSMTF